MLADASALGIGAWVIGAAAVLSLLSQIIGTFVFRRDLESTERLMVARADAAEARIKVLEDRDDKVRDLISELEGSMRQEIAEMERRLNEGSEQRAKETHDRINLVLSSLSELRGHVNATSRAGTGKPL